MVGVTRIRAARWAAAAAAAALLCGCAAGGPGPAASTASPVPPSSTGPAYEPAAVSEVYLPTKPPDGAVPVVLVVPGGGWSTSDRTGMTPLAKALAAAGFFTVNASYRAGADGEHFPVPLQDVQCAAGYAVAEAKAAGLTPGAVVLVGHSAGGHLVALAGTSGPALARRCKDPVPTIAGVVGLAGVYDTAGFASYLGEFFGTSRSQDQKLWDSGDPIHYVVTHTAPRPLSVLLIHGDADTTVPVAQAEDFARALKDAGMTVELDVVPAASHMDVIRPDVAAAPITAWIHTLT
jgi:acetyl esterase/lipase